MGAYRCTISKGCISCKKLLHISGYCQTDIGIYIDLVDSAVSCLNQLVGIDSICVGDLAAKCIDLIYNVAGNCGGIRG